jgi:hypothetical protein
MGAWIQEPQSLLPTAEPTRDDIMFFAGFYEGEGCATGTKNGGCVVQVPQKDPEMLYRARSFWGGSVRKISTRECWAWVITGDRARLFLQAIYEHLSARRKGQVEKSGAFKLTGRVGASASGMTTERAAARAAMGDLERRRETGRVSAKANYAKHRERVNELQREHRKRLRAEFKGDSGNTVPTTSERSQLVN